MNWTIKEPPRDQHGKLNEFLERHIIGFDAANAQILEQVGRRQADPLLPVNMAGVSYPSIWQAAYLFDVSLSGVISSTVAYEMVVDVVNTTGNIEHARGFARERRVISGIAVSEGARGQGIGKALLRANETVAKRQGASVVVGFMADVNGSPRFYRSAGYSVMPHNKPLPMHIGKFGLNEVHDGDLNGHWFYKEI